MAAHTTPHNLCADQEDNSKGVKRKSNKNHVGKSEKVRDACGEKTAGKTFKSDYVHAQSKKGGRAVDHLACLRLKPGKFDGWERTAAREGKNGGTGDDARSSALKEALDVFGGRGKPDITRCKGPGSFRAKGTKETLLDAKREKTPIGKNLESPGLEEKGKKKMLNGIERKQTRRRKKNRSTFVGGKANQRTLRKRGAGKRIVRPYSKWWGKEEGWNQE